MSFIDTPETYRYAWSLRPFLAMLLRRGRGVAAPVRLLVPNCHGLSRFFN